MSEIDWPSTLRGEAAEVYARWDRELRPGDFRLRAQIVEYLDEIPNNIALSLSWATPQSNEMKHGLSHVGGFGRVSLVERGNGCRTDHGSHSDDL